MGLSMMIFEEWVGAGVGFGGDGGVCGAGGGAEGFAGVARSGERVDGRLGD
jgi:hypothetical protein